MATQDVSIISSIKFQVWLVLCTTLYITHHQSSLCKSMVIVFPGPLSDVGTFYLSDVEALAGFCNTCGGLTLVLVAYQWSPTFLNHRVGVGTTNPLVSEILLS